MTPELTTGLMRKIRKAGNEGYRKLSSTRCLVCGERIEVVLRYMPRRKLCKYQSCNDHRCSEKAIRLYEGRRKGERQTLPVDASKGYDDKLRDAELMMGND